MLPEILVGLAASGGTAVVTAAGTDAWTGTRTTVARLLGRDGQREEAVLRRLDQTAADLAQSAAEDNPGAALEQTRLEQSGAWATRFRDLLQDLPEPERTQAVEELRSLIESVGRRSPGAGASAATGGLAVTGDMIVEATHGSVAAGVVNGDVRMDPQRPGATQD
jgi:hypothetical protein